MTVIPNASRSVGQLRFEFLFDAGAAPGHVDFLAPAILVERASIFCVGGGFPKHSS
jgi:hypothetical protein